MAQASTLYRFRIDLSDVDRGVYKALDFRVAMHPSETTQFLLTRVLAYALNAQDGLEFAPGGLSDPDEPCVRALDANGTIRLWIEVGKPSARKLHKASKAAQSVRIYTYKDPELVLAEIASGGIYRAERIEVYSFGSAFLDRIAVKLARDNSWSLLHHEGALTLGIGEHAEPGEITRHPSRV